MLVVTANWCLADGTLVPGPSRGPIRRLRREVWRAGLRFGFRRDGRYRPVESIDVVLAGDTFDWLVSREWTAAARPWHPGPRTIASFRSVMEGSFQRGRRLLAALAAWTRRGMRVAAADRRGRPLPGMWQTVPVRVTMLAGDRDRDLTHGAAGSAMAACGFAVGGCWSNADVTVLHGDVFDPWSAASDEGPSLGESLAVDLFARFGGQLIDSGRLRSLAPGIMRRLTGGPPVDMAKHLADLLACGGRSDRLPAAARRELHDVWRRAVDDWQRSARRLSPRGCDGIDIAGGLAERLGNVRGAATGAWPQPGPMPQPVARWAPVDGGTFILGHVANDQVIPPAWRTRMTSLAADPASSPPDFDDDAAAPAAVVVRRDAAGRQIERLSLGGSPPTDAAREPGEDDAAVWVSHAMRNLDRVVDAA